MLEDPAVAIADLNPNQPYLHYKPKLNPNKRDLKILLVKYVPFGAAAPSNPGQQDKLILDNLIEDHGFVGHGIINPRTSSPSRQRISLSGVNKNKGKRNDDEPSDLRKFVHREIERQRRQEMANLCGSLRTLLPAEYIKGKRSMCDSMQEAVNYIKDKRDNIHQLEARRDKLKKCVNSGLGKRSRDNNNNNNNDFANFVTVNPCSVGMEILINTSSFEEDQQGFSLSGILKELVERGFNVMSCSSTKTDQERSLHRILLEASNPTLNDLSQLQERLTYIINCPPSR